MCWLRVIYCRLLKYSETIMAYPISIPHDPNNVLQFMIPGIVMNGILSEDSDSVHMGTTVFECKMRCCENGICKVRVVYVSIGKSQQALEVFVHHCSSKGEVHKKLIVPMNEVLHIRQLYNKSLSEGVNAVNNELGQKKELEEKKDTEAKLTTKLLLEKKDNDEKPTEVIFQESRLLSTPLEEENKGDVLDVQWVASGH